MVFLLHSHNHWCHTNCWGSKYKDAIVTFGKFGTSCISKNFSIWNIHVMGFFPSSFIMSILGSWIPLLDHPWLLPILSNPLRACLLIDGWSTRTLYLSSQVPYPTSLTLERFYYEFCRSLKMISMISSFICSIFSSIFIPFSPFSSPSFPQNE